MEHKLFSLAIDNIINEVKTEHNYCGWSSSPSANLSRTVTAQIIATLSKYCEFENDSSRKKNILSIIDKGFCFLKNTIQTGHSELPTFAFTLIAHFEHQNRYKLQNSYDLQLINKCVTEIRTNKDFYFEGEKAYQYSNSIDRKYFPTYLVLEAFLYLLDFIEANPSITLESISKDDLKEQIENCFKYIFNKYNLKIQGIDTCEFSKSAEYLTIGILSAKLYEEYSIKYSRSPISISTKKILDDVVTYFTKRLDSDVFNQWYITIDRTPFVFIYVSHLILGLYKFRDCLSVEGIKLLHSLCYFISCDNRIQEMNGDSILYTKYKNYPVWATAQSLNLLMELSYSITELKWVDSIDKKATRSISEISSNALNHDQEESPNKKGLFVKILSHVYLISSIAIVAYLYNRFILLIEGIAPNVLVKFLFLIGVAVLVYYLPKIISYLASSFLKLFQFSEINEKKVATIAYMLAIIGYTLMIFFYITHK